MPTKGDKQTKFESWRLAFHDGLTPGKMRNAVSAIRASTRFAIAEEHNKYLFINAVPPANYGTCVYQLLRLKPLAGLGKNLWDLKARADATCPGEVHAAPDDTNCAGAIEAPHDTCSGVLAASPGAPDGAFSSPPDTRSGVPSLLLMKLLDLLRGAAGNNSNRGSSTGPRSNLTDTRSCEPPSKKTMMKNDLEANPT